MAIVAGRGINAGRAGSTDVAASDVTSGSSHSGISQREDLANFISMITRDETPFMSSIGKTKATAIYHEWQTDELNEPGNSRIGEGSDWAIPQATEAANSGNAFTGGAADATGAQYNVVGPNRTRLGNYCQINGKTMAVSNTRRAIDQAGVADEYAYQLKKRGTELRRDVEHDLIHSYNIASASGARTAGGIASWINSPDTCVVAGSALLPGTTGYVGTNGGTSGTAGQGTGRAVPNLNATTGSLSLSDIDQVMQNIYEEGGKASRIMLSPKLRRDFSDLMVNDSGVRRNIDEGGKLRQSVDVYMSDFGDLMVVPNYIMGLSNTPTADAASGVRNVNTQNSMALIYDPQWFSIATLRPMQEVEVGNRGDSTIGMMVEEFTMEVKNPRGCGAIYGLA